MTTDEPYYDPKNMQALTARLSPEAQRKLDEFRAQLAQLEASVSRARTPG